MSAERSRIEIPRLAVAFALLLVGVGIYPLPDVIPNNPGLASEHVRFWVGASLITLGPVLALAALPMAWIRALPVRAARLLRRPSPLVFAAIVGVVFAGLAVFFAWYSYHFAPTSADEIAQLWHARILLHGRAALPADPNFEFFAVDNVVDQGGWYSQFPIGGPLVLALGYLMHAPWLLDPILGGITAVALYLFARRAYGETQGRAIAALFVLTPVALLMSASYMNHVPVLLLAMLVLAMLVEWERTDSARSRYLLAAGMGLALGFMATIRPLDALVFSLCVGLFQAAEIRRTPARWRELLMQGVLGAIGVAPLLWGNLATTGGMLHFGYEVLWGPAHRLGFHVDPHGVAHTPLRALMLAAKYVSELNSYVVAWTLPALLVMVAGLVSMRRTSKWDALLFGLFTAQLVAYALYWHDGEFLGPRFLYTVLPVTVVLLARTPFLVADRWGGYWRHGAPIAVLTLVGVSWLVPMSPYGAMGLANDVRGARTTFKVDVAAAATGANAHHALVFVHEPFSGRLMRRLWGLGFTRSQAAQVFAQGDACSILEAVRMGEADSTMTPTDIASHISTYAPGAAPIRALDPTIRISSEQSLTPACKEALALDAAYGGMPFGPALLLEPIGPDGRLNGDVIYAVDLGERNEVLRARFGDRTWYRAWSEQEPDGSVRAVVGAY